MTDDYAEVTRLILSERQGRDRGRWSQMRDAFHPESWVRLSWFEGDGPGFVDASTRMSDRGQRAVHRLAPPAVDVVGERAIAEVSATVEFQVELEGVAAHLVSYTRLNYRFERQDDGWKIRALDAIYERDTLTPAVPGDTVRVGRSELEGLRTSYQLIGLHMRSLGYTVPEDLLGDDEPERVADFYNRALGWLEGRSETSHVSVPL